MTRLLPPRLPMQHHNSSTRLVGADVLPVNFGKGFQLVGLERLSHSRHHEGHSSDFPFGLSLVVLDDPRSECLPVLQAGGRRLALCALLAAVCLWRA
jgi:hypothetical protein